MRMIVVGSLLGLLFVTGCGGGEAKGPTLAQQAKQAMESASPEVKTTKLIAVSAKQQQAGDVNGANASMAAAADAAKSVENLRQRVASICAVVAAQQGAGNSKDLLKVASKALDEITDAKDKATATARYALAIGLNMKEKDKATAYLKNAADEAGKIEVPADKAAALLTLASTYNQLEETEAAGALTTSALAVAESIEDGRKKCETLASAGLTLTRMKQDAAAKKAFDDAVSVASKMTGDPLAQGYSYLDIATRLILAGQKKEAAVLLDKAYAIGDKADASLKGSLIDAIYRQREKL